jgi:hypothetical protein
MLQEAEEVIKAGISIPIIEAVEVALVEEEEEVTSHRSNIRGMVEVSNSTGGQVEGTINHHLVDNNMATLRTTLEEEINNKTLIISTQILKEADFREKITIQTIVEIEVVVEEVMVGISLNNGALVMLGQEGGCIKTQTHKWAKTCQ